MPPAASSKRPLRSLIAPVNAPFSWPNSSLSSSVSGRAAQLTVTNGLRGAPAVVMDGARDQFLARAALAAQQHRRVALGDVRDQVVYRLHRAGVADDVCGPEAVLQGFLEAQVLLEQMLRAS